VPVSPPLSLRVMTPVVHPSGEVVVDAVGQRCPGPMLALAAAVTQHPDASSWLLISDDPATPHDVPAWCRMKGLSDLGVTEVEGRTAYRIGAKASGVDSAASSSTR
jgi:tRNA 2-thiouridine synthesizing protein A